MHCRPYSRYPSFLVAPPPPSPPPPEILADHLEAAYSTFFPFEAGHSPLSVPNFWYHPSYDTYSHPSGPRAPISSLSAYESFYPNPNYTGTTPPPPISQNPNFNYACIVPPALPPIGQNPNPNYTCGASTNSTTLAGATAAGQQQEAAPPTALHQQSSPSSTAGCNTSGGSGGDERRPVAETSSAAASRMGGGKTPPGYHCIVKAFDENHRCDENFPDSDGDENAAADDGWEYYESSWDQDYAGEDGPYHQGCVHGTDGMTADGAGDTDGSGKSSYGMSSQDLQAETPESTTLTNAEPKSSKAVAILFEGDPVYEEVGKQGLQTTASIPVLTMSTDSEPEYSLNEEYASLGQLDQCVLITMPTTAKETSRTSIEARPKFSQIVAATAEHEEPSADPSVLQMPTDPSQKESFCDELEGSLQEEARKELAARELRRKRKLQTNKSSASTKPAGDEDYTNSVDYALAKQLIGYEALGYLTKLDGVDAEDESLLHYGDRFGLAVLSEYPDFFMHVPQHPHYKKASLEEVDAAGAELLWEIFMPLMRRGLRAARENNASDVVAVKQVIAGLEAQGFDLKHLEAYMSTARRLWAALRSVEEEVERVDYGVESEADKIRAIMASKPLRETIEELEKEKARCQELIRSIEASLAEKMALLGEEEGVRETRSTPAMEELLKTRDYLDKRVECILDDFEKLRLWG